MPSGQEESFQRVLTQILVQIRSTHVQQVHLVVDNYNYCVYISIDQIHSRLQAKSESKILFNILFTRCLNLIYIMFSVVVNSRA